MNKFICKALFLSILSFTIPAGRLFDLFIWQDSILKTETNFQVNRLETHRRLCLFVRIIKEINAKFLFKLKKKYNNYLHKINHNLKTRTKLLNQNYQFNEIKEQLTKNMVFNIIYSDVPENSMI